MRWLFMPSFHGYEEGNPDLYSYCSLIAVLSIYIDNNPNDAQGYISRGFTFLSEGDEERALRDFEEAINISADFGAYLGRSVALHHAFQDEEALSAVDELVNLFPDEMQAHLWRGTSYYDLRRTSKYDYDTAAAAYEKAFSLSMESPYLYYEWAARVYRDRADSVEDYTRAIFLISEYSRFSPDPSRHYEFLASCYSGRVGVYISNGEYHKAITDVDRAIELDPSRRSGYLRTKAHAYFREDDFDRAIVSIDEAIRLSPEDIWLLHDRGYLYLEMADYDKALRSFDEAISLDPNSRRSYFLRAKSYYAMAEYGSAIEDFSKAIEISESGYSDAHVGRGNAYRELQDYDKALADYDEAIRLNPNSACPYRERAAVHRAMGMDAKASDDLARANMLCPQE